jgi:hypothetical protein
MSSRSFKLQDILPNPFRRLEKYPLRKEKIERIAVSIRANGFWSNTLNLRINSNGKPEAAFGHHRLAAARQVFPGNKLFDWTVEKLTDGQMIQHMASENSESYKTDASVMRETIRAAVQALGEGKILADEMPIDPKTNTTIIRYAPGFGCAVAATAHYPYTKESLAKFLGEVDGRHEPTIAFRTAFTSLELITEGFLDEKTLEGLEPWKVTEAIRAARADRDAAVKNAKVAEQEIEKKKQEAAQQVELQRKRREEAEAAAAARREANTQREKAEAKKRQQDANAKLVAATKEAEKRAEEIRRLAEKMEKDRKQEQERAKENTQDFVQDLEGRKRDELRAARARAKELEDDAKARKHVAEDTDSNEEDYDDDSGVEEMVARRFREHRDKLGREAQARLVKKKINLPEIWKEAKAIVDAGKRHLAKTAHPDSGGTHIRMQNVNAAAEWLLQYILKEENEKPT